MHVYIQALNDPMYKHFLQISDFYLCLCIFYILNFLVCVANQERSMRDQGWVGTNYIVIWPDQSSRMIMLKKLSRA